MVCAMGEVTWQNGLPTAMNEGKLINEIHGFADVARDASCVREYDSFALERFDRLVGFDVATIARAGVPSEIAPGFDHQLLRTWEAHWNVYASELGSFVGAALATGGAAIDREFFGARELERKAYYQELMAPLHGRSCLIAYLTRRGQVQAKLVLGRVRSTRDFTDDERRLLVALVPTLCLCEAALRSPTPEPTTERALTRLTPREREVVQYLELGYTNAEIALACGTAQATVRNQLSSVFEKLGVSTRAEAVALTIRSSRGV
jgi:DNA-binding CsgD family transcriptional regulator